MEHLADAVLPLIRTRSDLHRWRDANSHGAQMHDAVDILEEAADAEDPAVVLAVTQKAIASAVKVIMRADDSSGVIGDACRRLLALHPQVAATARPPVAKLVDWMVKFQFDNECDFFEIDPVGYAPALGDAGVAAYRLKLDGIRAGLGEPSPIGERWSSPDASTWFRLDENARRLAVLDRDVEAVIRTHARDRKVARWIHDTAKALEEIGEVDLAIDWARQATEFDRGHQSLAASEYWCALLEAHRPDGVLAARLSVFRRWPSSTTAARLHRAAGAAWPSRRDEVMQRLSDSPRDAVLFALLHLHDVRLAWDLAHSLALDDGDAWSRVVDEYESVDPLAVLPVLRRLAEADLEVAGAQHYRDAGRRLARMRRLAAGTAGAAEVDALVAELRVANRRRPRLQLEFDRAGLP
ncbi:MAG: DUF6880 family protein [Ornithinibacter sp.]